MGATFSAAKELIIPALISLILFLVSTYVLYPLWVRYRTRYSNYLPLETISNQTSGLRARVQDGIARYLAPSMWRRNISERLVVAETSSEGDFDSEDGEELGDVDDSTLSAYAHRQSSSDNTRRLSRDLEEGFMDDSDEESEESRRR
ncbi:hypothetical protein OQA88_6502 [Cercophora sp. LCS_1]